MEEWRRGRVNDFSGKGSQGTHMGNVTIGRERVFLRVTPNPLFIAFSIYLGFEAPDQSFSPFFGLLATFTQFLAPLGVLSSFEGFYPLWELVFLFLGVFKPLFIFLSLFECVGVK